MSPCGFPTNLLSYSDAVKQDVAEATARFPRIIPGSPDEGSPSPLMVPPRAPLLSSNMPDQCAVATFTDGHQVNPLTPRSKSLVIPPRPVPKLGHLLKLLADPRLRSYQVDLEPRRLRGSSRFPSRLGVKIRGHPIRVSPSPVTPLLTTTTMSRALLRLRLSRLLPPRQQLGRNLSRPSPSHSPLTTDALKSALICPIRSTTMSMTRRSGHQPY